jgi:hypothetical protein
MPVRYTATVKIVIPQLVHCVSCDCKFIYEMTVTGHGFAESSFFTSTTAAREAAGQHARDSVEAQLNKRDLCKAVPCRNCFRYQPYMHKLVAQQKYDAVGCIVYPLIVLGFLATVGSIIAWFTLSKRPPTLLWIGIGGLSAWIVGYVMLRWWRRLIARYDPNSERLAERQKCAAKQAISLEDYDESQKTRVRSAYAEYVQKFTVAARVTSRQPDSIEGLPEPLILAWWVVPSLFLFGGTLSLDLSKDDNATVVIPEDAKPGCLLELATHTPLVLPFRVQVLPMHVHPDEARLE